MRLRQRGRNRDGFLRITARFRVRGWALAGEVPNHRPRFGTLCVSQGIIRVDIDCPIEVSNGFAIVLDVTAQKMEMALKISVVRLYALRDHLGRIVSRAEQSHLQ